jgi:hypothetical protein
VRKAPATACGRANLGTCRPSVAARRAWSLRCTCPEAFAVQELGALWAKSGEVTYGSARLTTVRRVVYQTVIGRWPRNQMQARLSLQAETDSPAGSNGDGWTLGDAVPPTGGELGSLAWTRKGRVPRTVTRQVAQARRPMIRLGGIQEEIDLARSVLIRWKGKYSLGCVVAVLEPPGLGYRPPLECSWVNAHPIAGDGRGRAASSRKRNTGWVLLHNRSRYKRGNFWTAPALTVPLSLTTLLSLKRPSLLRLQRSPRVSFSFYPPLNTLPPEYKSMYSSLSLLALGLASAAAAQKPGSIVEVGDTLVSAMMVSTPVDTRLAPTPPHLRSTTDVHRQ